MRARAAGWGRRHGERGAVNMAMLMVAMVMTMGGVVLFAVMSMAAGSVQRHQSAADAAALAGADAFGDYGASYFAAGWADPDDLPGLVGASGPCPGVVRNAASKYATLNKTTLTACQMTGFGEVKVRVRGDVAGSDDTHDAVAAASWGFPLDECSIDPGWDPEPPPTEEPEPPEDGEEPPAEPEEPEGPSPEDPAPTWMQCGPYKVHLMYDGAVYKVVPWGQVKDHIEPRLTD